LLPYSFSVQKMNYLPGTYHQKIRYNTRHGNYTRDLAKNQGLVGEG
jgi:hypothetical protein